MSAASLLPTDQATVQVMQATVLSCLVWLATGSTSLLHENIRKDPFPVSGTVAELYGRLPSKDCCGLATCICSHLGYRLADDAYKP